MLWRPRMISSLGRASIHPHHHPCHHQPVTVVAMEMRWCTNRLPSVRDDHEPLTTLVQSLDDRVTEHMKFVSGMDIPLTFRYLGYPHAPSVHCTPRSPSSSSPSSSMVDEKSATIVLGSSVACVCQVPVTAVGAWRCADVEDEDDVPPSIFRWRQ